MFTSIFVFRRKHKSRVRHVHSPQTKYIFTVFATSERRNRSGVDKWDPTRARQRLQLNTVAAETAELMTFFLNFQKSNVGPDDRQIFQKHGVTVERCAIVKALPCVCERL